MSQARQVALPSGGGGRGVRREEEEEPEEQEAPGTSPGVGGGGAGDARGEGARGGAGGGGGGFVDAPQGQRGGGALRRAGGVGRRHGFPFLCFEGVPARSHEPPCFFASSPPPSDSP